MNRITICFLLILASSFALSTDAADQPNVIVIYTDDQGTLDLNCYGSDDLYTPNIDSLANRGVHFTQFYVGSAICSPSAAR